MSLFSTDSRHECFTWKGHPVHAHETHLNPCINSKPGKSLPWLEASGIGCQGSQQLPIKKSGCVEHEYVGMLDKYLPFCSNYCSFQLDKILYTGSTSRETNFSEPGGVSPPARSFTDFRGNICRGGSCLALGGESWSWTKQKFPTCVWNTVKWGTAAALTGNPESLASLAHLEPEQG